MKNKTLYLTLKKKWFGQIAEGKKKEEYREVKPYWIARLLHKKFDEIWFSNGYGANVPFMRVEWKGLKYKKIQGINYYAIQLGNILEIRKHKKR